MPKISVIMSVYNEPEEWLREAIESIIEQTFSDFEFLIINDNPDNSENDTLLREYAENDRRIVLIINEKNLGLTRSLNKGLKIAKGDYIARMDADDRSLPYRFERQVEFLDNHPGVLCVGSWVKGIDYKGVLNGHVSRYESDYKWVRAQFVQNSQISHPSAMYHRIINNELIKYDETFRFAQDYSLMVRILQYGEIANIPEFLLEYRTSNTQITSIKRTEQLECAFRVQKKAFSLFSLNTTREFQELYHHMTIKHEYKYSNKVVVDEFRNFFDKNRRKNINPLVLELIYGNFFTYFFYRNKGVSISVFHLAFKNSTPYMLLLGVKLFCHLLIRKVRRML